MTTLRVAYLIGALLLTAGYAQGLTDLFVFVPLRNYFKSEMNHHDSQSLVCKIFVLVGCFIL